MYTDWVKIILIIYLNILQTKKDAILVSNIPPLLKHAALER